MLMLIQIRIRIGIKTMSILIRKMLENKFVFTFHHSIASFHCYLSYLCRMSPFLTAYLNILKKDLVYLFFHCLVFIPILKMMPDPDQQYCIKLKILRSSANRCRPKISMMLYPFFTDGWTFLRKLAFFGGYSRPYFSSRTLFWPPPSHIPSTTWFLPRVAAPLHLFR